MDTTEIPLAHPVGENGTTLTSLHIRRPKVRDRLAVDKLPGTEADREVRFIANLCEVSPDTIEELDMADYVRVQEVLAGFFD